MKISKWALSAALAATCLGGQTLAQAPVQSSASDFGYYASDAAPVTTAAQARAEYASVIPAACACGDAPVSSGVAQHGNYGSSLGCDLGGCDGYGCDGFGNGCDTPWKLFQNPVLGFNVGGWTQTGWHSRNNTLFNQHGDDVNLHQAWVYAEKIADGSRGLGLGGRIDYLYGVDAQDTQAFGVTNNSWDNSWDNGIYGHAIPQLYLEAAYGDLSVKVGHFFTLMGYEKVAAPSNFFYSHNYGMYNSRPFTHTGVLATYDAGDDLKLFGGYVMGWDSGFEDNGDAFLGGYSYDVSDRVNYASQVMVGRFGENQNSEVGFKSTSILTTQVSCRSTYVIVMDYLDTDGSGRAVERQTFDLNQYWLYAINDRLTWGNRLEWYNIDKDTRRAPRGYNVTNGRSDVYALTTGLNYAATSNFLVRPELRWDWDKDGVIGNELGQSQTTVAADMIFTF